MTFLTPRKIKETLPLTATQKQFVQKSRETIRDLVTGKDGRLAIVMGPCSIHDLSSALEYGRRLRALAEEVSAVLVMRVYIEKPRTVTGWKGLAYDPHLDGSNDIQTGIFWARELFLTLTDLGIPIATEVLNPLFLPYLEDLISWGFIGARTSASQPHREIASHLPFPIGFKNSPDGNIEQAIHAMIAASTPHRFPHINDEGNLTLLESEGNSYSHVVLRGSKTNINYDPKSIAETIEIMQTHGLKNRLLIDCSHGNCQKEYGRQREAFHAVLEQFERGNHKILGMMLESNLEEGYQYLSESPSSLKYAVSVTDPCLGWSETEALVRSSSVMRFTQS
ncbi:MAG TPA: 3-deoxy-7-phosphoheptulonate synthase [Rhabdochlamydiaceae bacterium]|nr:3-deoxy-7-phosphoheptulonate synthase [Rhabdochlamydiaceae bacterium]